MCFAALTWGGDSGSPVWVEGTGVTVGILTTGSQDPPEPKGKSVVEKEVKEGLEEFGEYLLQKNLRKPSQKKKND